MTDNTKTIVRLGTPLKSNSFRVLFCGSGELGKEVVIELQRFGVEVIAIDRYADAPAMQVAHRSHVVDMLDPVALRSVIARPAVAGGIATSLVALPRVARQTSLLAQRATTAL